MKNIKFLIVGGGIAGLYILKKLVADNNTEIVLLESTPNIGGRIKTAYTENNNVKYETGAWRIHNNHKNMLKLVKNLNLRMHQTTSSRLNTRKKNLDICYKSEIKNNKFDKIPGLSYSHIVT
jgi:protoporphyrinogen oxidase